MISPSELRVGNWVMCHDPKRREDPKQYPLQINWRHIKELSMDENLSDYYPIAITHDLLLNSNWKTKDDNATFYHPKFENLLTVQKKGDHYMMTLQQEKELGVPFQYLHQLQNRFYSLAGEEMEVTI